MSINELLETSLKNILEITDCNIIIGDEITLGDAHIIPVSKVKCTFLSGGIDQKNENYQKMPFGGITGGNVGVTPIAFLVYLNGEVKLLLTEENSHIFEKLVDLVEPTAKNLQNFIKSKMKKDIN